jgi:CBS domain-containing protein
VTIGYEESIQKGSDLMLQHRFRHLPVTDSMGEVIGILSDRDIQRAMEVRRQGIEVERVISPTRRIKDFMSWPPHTISDELSLSEVIRFMIREKISALLVHSAKTGKVRGIITTEDLLKEFGRLLETYSPQEGALIERR